MSFLKEKLKFVLTERQHKIYEKEVADRNLSYDGWIRGVEKNIGIEPIISDKIIKNLTNDLGLEDFGRDKDCDEGKDAKNDGECRMVEVAGKRILLVNSWVFCENAADILEQTDSDIVLLSFYEGRVNEIAYGLICEEFDRNENVVLVYGDEDIEGENGRENPWFKPDWSPDRFLSCFYFGGLVAVRTRAVAEAMPMAEPYMFLLELLKRHRAFAPGHEELRMPVCHIRQILYHSRKNGYEQVKKWKLPEEAVKSAEGPEVLRADSALLSIVVPSKDNPEVLFQCLNSLIHRTQANYNYEIILVDNGSREENRNKISQKVGDLNESDGIQAKGEGGLKSGCEDECKGHLLSCTYLYEPMPFNFSAMCNMGAQAAKGEVLLFLNDDMEIIRPDWMNLMMEKALLPYVGAVGAKLLYPNSFKIQHAGITNLRVGPAHKLQFLSDEDVHYFGMNRGVHNMLAATGACLMMRKSVFTRAGGFYEGLAVAFNDVDLCYSIYEKGYYNVVRNDVTLYHHESLSRGNDGESEEKQLRLLKEKDILYERHQDIYGRDPFYHPCLTTDMLESSYSPAYHYQVTLDMPWSEPELFTQKMAGVREDECLRVGMECAMDIYKWQYGVSPEKGKVKPEPEDMGYYFQGYSFVIGSDNACYKKILLLKNQESGQIWAIPIDNRYRQDISNNLKDQINVDLTGFAAKLQKKAIPAGVYQFGMLAKDQCSRQKLVNWSSWVLEVTGDGE